MASSPVMEAANQQFKDAFFFLFAGKSYTIFALLFGFTSVSDTHLGHDLPGAGSKGPAFLTQTVFMQERNAFVSVHVMKNGEKPRVS